MHEVRPGFWIPDNFGGEWLFNHTNSLTPLHSLDRIGACLEACGSRKRLAIDGGAFVGSWSIHLASKFDRVIAYEPITENFQCLVENTRLVRPRVEVHQAALTDHAGPMERKDPRLKVYGQQVQHVTNLGVPCEFSGVAIDQLDLTDLDLLKLDVESHEYEALLGARATIARCKPVVMIEERFDSAKRATALLSEWGMTCTWSKKHDYLFTWA